MGVPGSNPGGPMIFRRKSKDRQSSLAGGGRRLGRGRVSRGPMVGRGFKGAKCHRKPPQAMGLWKQGIHPIFQLAKGERKS